MHLVPHSRIFFINLRELIYACIHRCKGVQQLVDKTDQILIRSIQHTDIFFGISKRCTQNSSNARHIAISSDKTASTCETQPHFNIYSKFISFFFFSFTTHFIIFFSRCFRLFIFDGSFARHLGDHYHISVRAQSTTSRPCFTLHTDTGFRNPATQKCHSEITPKRRQPWEIHM